MKKFKNIFFVLSLFLFAGFSALLFLGEVSAQEVCGNYENCLQTTFSVADSIGDTAKIEYCFCSENAFNSCVIDYEESDEVSCNEIMRKIDGCDGGFVNYESNQCSSLSEAPICPVSILSEYYDINDDKCCIAPDICQDYMDGNICKIPVEEGSDNTVAISLCEECIAPVDGSCSDAVRVVDDNYCCVCGGDTFLKNDGECYVDEINCLVGSVGAGACNIEITEGGVLRSVIGVPLGTADPEPKISCGKGILLAGQSCCDGYKKISENGVKKCKECGVNGVCCGVKLSTNVPFIGDCIQFKKSATDPDTTVVGPTSAFPKLMQGLSKIMVTAILIFSFVLLVVAGVMMTAGGADEGSYTKGKQLIGKVIVGIAILGASGVILKLINPNFFG